MSGLVIETQNLTKYYGKLKALDDLSIKVKGGIIGFLGPNAAGKTTTIKILLGLLRPTAGEATVLGIDPTKNPLEVRARVGFLPENPKPYKNMSGWEFLDFVAKLRGIPASERKKEISTLLERVGLLERAKDKIASYSRGMIQRLFLAQTLLGNPELILLDEPTTGLDPLGREEVLSICRELGRAGRSVFISSHILSEVERVCDRVLIIDRGQLILEGDVERIKEEFASGRYRVKVDNPETVIKEISQQSYVREAWVEGDRVIIIPSNEVDFRKGIFELSAKLGCELLSLEKELPSLQDVFISLIKKRGGVVK